MRATLPLLLALSAPLDDEDVRRASDRSHLEGELAPALAVGSWLGSEALTLEDLRDQVVLIQFWGAWSAACQREVDRLRTLHETRSEAGLVVLGVHTSDGWDKAVDFVAAHGIRYPVCHDEHQETQEAYELDRVPEYHLVDRRGVLRFADLDRRDLEIAVEQLLGEGDLTGRVAEWVEAYPRLRLEVLVGDEVRSTTDLAFERVERGGEACVAITTTRSSGGGRSEERLVAQARDLVLLEVTGRSEGVSFAYTLEEGLLSGERGDEDLRLRVPMDLATPELALLRALLLPFEPGAEVAFTGLDAASAEVSGERLARYVGVERADLAGSSGPLHVVELVREDDLEARLLLDEERALLGLLPGGQGAGEKLKVSCPDED